MVKSDGNKYCDWCGKYCGPGGIDSWFHNFCSERCRRAYDNANGTVDGGYKHGSIGHDIHKAGSKIGNFFKILLYIVFGGAIVLGIIIKFFR